MELPSLQRMACNITAPQLEEEIGALKAQIAAHPSNIAENQYDELAIQIAERRLEIMQENPNLDPSNSKDLEILDEKVNAATKDLQNQMQELAREHPYESTSWGIPLFDN